jgi:hypothetical protein
MSKLSCPHENPVLQRFKRLWQSFLDWFAKHQLRLELPWLGQVEGRLDLSDNAWMKVEMLQVGAQAFCFERCPCYRSKSLACGNKHSKEMCRQDMAHVLIS